MKPHAQKARSLLEEAMARDPENPWAIHLYTHLMEAGGEAEAAVAPAQKLQYLVPGAPHLQVRVHHQSTPLELLCASFCRPSSPPTVERKASNSCARPLGRPLPRHACEVLVLLYLVF